MVQWYPGHMAKALREMEEKIKLVDLIYILIDSRIPYSSLNPKLKEMFANKKVIYIFTKADKADPSFTTKWKEYYELNDGIVLCADVRNPKTINLVEKASLDLMKAKREKDASRGIKPRPIKCMIVGIPNVGKSTLINTLVKKKVAIVGDKPGVTKSQQWTRINQNLELLDTPGVLWPKFDDEIVGYNLVITGAIKDTIIEPVKICEYFISYLEKYYHDSLVNRYHIEYMDSPFKTLEEIGKNLHFLTSSKEVDLDKTALFILQEYRNDYLGKITLDRNI